MFTLLKYKNIINQASCITKGKNANIYLRKRSLVLCTHSYLPVLSNRNIYLNTVKLNSDNIKYSPLLFYNSSCDNLKLLRTKNNLLLGRVNYFHTSVSVYGTEPPLKPSSKVEETVVALKEKAKEKEKQQKETTTTVTTTAGTVSTAKTVADKIDKPIKKPLKQRIIDELVHYYHGFRLLFIDINVSRKLLWRILQGKTLTRREYKLLVRTVGDLFRLVPFSVFIIVPFMELLLPFFIKFFPGMLPSTFQSNVEQDDKAKQSLKVKLEMAKFLQQTLDELPVYNKEGHSSQSAKEFVQFFENVRSSGGMTNTEDLIKFSKLFQDEITLDSLPRPQLMALCRVLEMNPIGTTTFLRFQLRLKLRSLSADDMMIQKEGVDALSLTELQQACRARGMRAFGVSEDRLKAQLSQWLDLSLIKKVPPSLLLLSQAFMLPDTITTSEKLAATISALPDTVGTRTKAIIGEREGKVDHKTKIELIKEEVKQIKEERLEQQEEEKKREAEEEKKAKEEEEKRQQEELIDKAPVTTEDIPMLHTRLRQVVEGFRKTPASDRVVSAVEEVTSKDLEALEVALDVLGKDKKKLIVEKEEIEDLRSQMSEYQEDIADLQKITSTTGQEDKLKETKAAQRLFKKVNKMISKMDNLLVELEEKESKKVDKQVDFDMRSELTSKATEGVLRIDELISVIQKMDQVPDKSRLERIAEVLSKIDADKDGAIKVDTVLKVLDLIGSENVALSKKQVDELIDLVDKEEAIELDEQIVKALKKKDDKPKKDSSTISNDTGNPMDEPTSRLKLEVDDSTPTTTSAVKTKIKSAVTASSSTNASATIVNSSKSSSGSDPKDLR